MAVDARRKTGLPATRTAMCRVTWLLGAPTLLLAVACSSERTTAGGGTESSGEAIAGPSAIPAVASVDELIGATGVETGDVRFQEVAVLGAVSDSASIRPDAIRSCMIARLSDGQFLVSGIYGGGQLVRYPSSGGGATESIGRLGRGPGELGPEVRLTVGRGDTIHAFDDSNGRVQLFTREGGFVRSLPAPGGNDPIALLSDGRYLAHPYPTTMDDPLFLLVDPEGEVLRRFGEPEGEPDLDQRVIGAASGGGFWTASIWSYSLVRWDARGEPVGTLSRDLPWFPGGTPPRNEVEEFYQTRLPPPLVRHLWEDDAGRLWVYIQYPDERWSPGVTSSDVGWAQQTFDTVLEVVDLSSHQVVARGRVDDLLGRVCGTGLLYQVVEDPSGDTRVRVLRPVFATTVID